MLNWEVEINFKFENNRKPRLLYRSVSVYHMCVVVVYFEFRLQKSTDTETLDTAGRRQHGGSRSVTKKNLTNKNAEFLFSSNQL